MIAWVAYNLMQTRDIQLIWAAEHIGKAQGNILARGMLRLEGQSGEGFKTVPQRS